MWTAAWLAFGAAQMTQEHAWVFWVAYLAVGVVVLAPLGIFMWRVNARLDEEQRRREDEEPRGILK